MTICFLFPEASSRTTHSTASASTREKDTDGEHYSIRRKQNGFGAYNHSCHSIKVVDDDLCENHKSGHQEHRHACTKQVSSCLYKTYMTTSFLHFLHSASALIMGDSQESSCKALGGMIYSHC